MKRLTETEIKEALKKTVPDVIAPDLKLLLVGINPGIYTASVGHHFAHPANRFWKALFDSGLTPKLLPPQKENELLDYDFGITNMVARPTLRAAELSKDELLNGRQDLEKKVIKYRPSWVAILGLGAYRIAFQDKKAVIGPQKNKIGAAKIWVLPNPSGLNATFTPKKLASVLAELRREIS